MENNFDKVMSEKTNEELIKIVTIENSKYQKLALDSAEKEIESRNIDITEFNKIKDSVNIEKQKKDQLDLNTVKSSTRFVHFIVDTFIFFIFYVIVGSIFQAIFQFDVNKNFLFTWLLMVITFVFYYSFVEYHFQKTFGKYITKTKVVTINGEKPSLNDIIVRSFCRLIPFDRMSFLFIKNGFHDGLSNTRVVKE
ncbi:RDD family protein [Flavobacterium aquicola]|uniref:Putative RDD family membrane protein YckC n=1 Tax=Flavobacterium aquicola TaxID=1682742 RepID=A0A3E0ERP4_9FLAO|nr:RDD family protein [Flavobacterium aquicola]REH00050.1 putative RDD family membrane protein YckC [Flavobacterium aquicola]